LLGWLAQRAAFRLTIDRGVCQKCVACLQVCKSQCINLRTGTIDASRCVGCFNCLGACDHGGIGYRLAWRRKTRPSAPTGATAACRALPDPHRRAFLTGTATALAVSLGAGLRLSAQDPSAPERPQSGDAGGGENPDEHTTAICPPGAASIDRFLDRCTACHLCLGACPTQVLTPAFLEYGVSGLMKPRMEYSAAFCNFDCRRCGEVCPTGAITLLDLADKQLTQLGDARFDQKKCIVVVKGTDCAACSEHCPTKAVHTIPYGDNLRLPEVTRDLCIGCGACEYACPVQPEKAIVVAGHRRHGRARKPVETKAAAPAATGDFPF
jgi:ferredoxin